MGFKYTGALRTGESNQTITEARKHRKQTQHLTEQKTSFKIRQETQMEVGVTSGVPTSSVVSVFILYLLALSSIFNEDCC